MVHPTAISTLLIDHALTNPGESPARGATRLTLADGRIAAIDAAAGPGDGSLAIAAFANAHDHGRGLRTLAFGAYDDALESWIPTLSREPILPAYHRAAVAFARMAEGGIATTNHSHGYQRQDAAIAEAGEVARAAADVGIRVAFAAPFVDRNILAYGRDEDFLAAAAPASRDQLLVSRSGPRSIAAYLAEVEEIAAFESPNFFVQYCPVGPQWVSDGAMAAIAEASARTGRRIHMHLLETRLQREWADHAYPGGLVRRLDELGLLSPRLSVAHGVYLDPDDCALLAERGVIVSVNTTSNFRLRSGIAPVPAFLAAGLRFGLGLDASAFEDDDDFLREMRLAWLNHRGWGHDDQLSRARLFQAAQLDGRRAILGEDGGGLAIGAPADLLVLDYATMAEDILSPLHDPVAVLLNRATRRHIRQLIVGGRSVVENGRCVGVDRPGLEAELNEAAREAWSKAPPDDARAQGTYRAVRRYYGCGCHMGRPFSSD